MGKAKANCCCGGCKFRDNSCTSCLRCKPRFLCATVLVTPGPYTELSECCESFGFRLAWDCGDEANVYRGGGACADGISLSLEVEMIDTEEGCTTVVSCPLLAYPITFEGTLPFPMAFTVETDDGDSLAVTIAEANVIENPKAKLACAACSCASCLPAALCLQVEIFSHFTHDAETCEPTADSVPYKLVSITTPWDCVAETWESVDTLITHDGYPDEDQRLTVTFQWIPKEDGCGIRIIGNLETGVFGACVAGGDGTFDEILLLDEPIDTRRYKGTECKSNQNITHTIGDPEVLPCPPEFPECEDPRPQNYISFIDVPLALMTYLGWQVGSVRVTDASCGTCLACVPPIPELCCPSLPDELQISLQNAGGDTGSTSGVLTRGGEGNAWSGTFVVGPDGQFLYVSVICVTDAVALGDPDMPDDGWYLIYSGCAVLERFVVSLGETHPEDVDPTPPSALFDCNPLLIDHTILMGAGCSCWASCSAGTIHLVITA